jgi:hypothetical protein
MDEEKIIILMQKCLHNLQHKHYDNNLVKENCRKEIAGEWQGSGWVVAGSRHSMCESAWREMTRSTQENLTLCAATFSVWSFFYLNSITREIHYTAEDTLTTKVNMNTACQFILALHCM